MTLQDRVRLKIYMQRLWRKHMESGVIDPNGMRVLICQVADWYGVTFMEAVEADQTPLIDPIRSNLNIANLIYWYLNYPICDQNDERRQIT